MAAGAFQQGWPLAANVAALGFFNGVFAVAAIGSMMALAGAQAPGREGARMGLWGAAQAIAFGLGGLVGTGAVDAMRAILDANAPAYAAVFAAEAALFLVSAQMALRIGAPEHKPHRARTDGALLAGE
jgi:BCD family chlorophyll transporter-like MFS transporter